MRVTTRRLVLLAAAAALLASTAAGCTKPAIQTDDLAALGDNFGDPATLAEWTELSAAEGNTNWVETLDIATSQPGELYLVPYASGWFEDWRGVFLHKNVTGDFDATMKIKVSGKNAEVPELLYSFAGLMARAPRGGGIEAWEPKKENWLFITTGFSEPANGPLVPHLESKTTKDSVSDLRIIRSQTGWLELRVVRLGAHFYTLYRFEGEPWYFSRKYERADLPDTLQVGLTAYTNWGAVNVDKYKDPGDSSSAPQAGRFLVDPEVSPGDLVVRVDYVHFARPRLPEALRAKADAGVSLESTELLAAVNGEATE